ncbi:terpene cyclase/mutase family protein [Janibacter cremeus]|uniref:prenyltransferase/squalene oxidase repeat-containing protein n=1 Tax=Janibacter cremeus TaxID=1285192 RepID=UPI0023F6A4F8|nr:prenyltransferase/squalene oxidase repeat-containing protein [Janibacter cremeus]WEV79504.1 terpene cyclase/mutase family protein [Janibacter cremeus]
MRSVSTLALTASLGAVGLALAPAASAATPDDSVRYLADRLADGDDRLLVEAGGQSYADHGLTIDAVLGMSAAGTGGDAAAAATDWVVANSGAYIGSGEEAYSAATAKLLTFAGARGLDPRDVAGVDLVARLQSLEQGNGQFADQSEYGDYSNTLGQSFALIGLERAGVNPSTASVDFLLAQQCDDGGFRLNFDEPDTSQDDACVSDPDATSTAVQALDVVGGHDATVQDAADYLVSRQGADGGVAGGRTTEGVNANSAGLAAVAFRLAGREDARGRALQYLESVTFGCETPALAGGIAYNRADFDAATAQGADAQPDGTITRTTAQAILGQTDESYATVSASGQSAATPTLECATAEPSDDGTTGPTGPTDEATGDPADGTTEPTDDATAGPTTPTDGGTTAPEPERPEVVQTDGATTGTPDLLLALGAGGLTAALVVVARRRTAPQQR